MRLGGVDIPCGCEARKEVMFTLGRPGFTEAAILAIPLLILVTFTVRRHT